MTQNNGYNVYAQNKITMASPAELTLMLYEGAIKFCNIAIVAIENKDYAKANTNLQKAQRIIGEFQMTLDFKYEVAKDFDKVYEYLMYRLIQANVKKDIGMIEEALTHLRTMRDAWKEVMKLTKNGTDVA